LLGQVGGYRALARTAFAHHGDDAGAHDGGQGRVQGGRAMGGDIPPQRPLAHGGGRRAVRHPAVVHGADEDFLDRAHLLQVRLLHLPGRRKHHKDGGVDVLQELQ